MDLERLGGFLERLEGILSALGAILAENVAWTCLELAWNLHWSAEAGGPSEGGASLKGFYSQWSGASDSGSHS